MKRIYIIAALIGFTLTSFGQSWVSGTNKLYTSPLSSTIVGIGTSSPLGTNGEYQLKSRLDLRFDGDEKLTYGQRINLYSKLEVEKSYSLKGTFYSRLCDGAAWSSGGGGRGIFGQVTLKEISTSNSSTYVSGALLTLNLDNMTQSFNSNKYYLAGSHAKLMGSSANYPGNGIVSAVIGSDMINNSNTWAGYFEGKVGVTSTLYAEKVEVKLEGDWPDYVFTEGHELPDLQEVNTYIQQNGHLPEIPTAKEVEENGIDLGEMNAKLLKKVEELTLYTLEQQKAIDKLLEKMEKQDKVIEGLVTKTR